MLLQQQQCTKQFSLCLSCGTKLSIINETGANVHTPTNKKRYVYYNNVRKIVLLGENWVRQNKTKHTPRKATTNWSAGVRASSNIVLVVVHVAQVSTIYCVHYVSNVFTIVTISTFACILEAGNKNGNSGHGESQGAHRSVQKSSRKLLLNLITELYHIWVLELVNRAICIIHLFKNLLYLK